jgi:hypothetical protein
MAPKVETQTVMVTEKSALAVQGALSVGRARHAKATDLMDTLDSCYAPGSHVSIDALQRGTLANVKSEAQT